MKKLVVYYSWAGATRTVAKMLSELTNSDAVELQPVNKYPEDYQECVDQAKKEADNNFLPELTEKVDVSAYDVIFVGTPIWWYTGSPVLNSFLNNTDLVGKTIAPFSTHGGGGESGFPNYVQKTCINSTILKSFTCYGDNTDKNELENWLRKIKI